VALVTVKHLAKGLVAQAAVAKAEDTVLVKMDLQEPLILAQAAADGMAGTLVVRAVPD
jgi:hypothetical protein